MEVPVKSPLYTKLRDLICLDQELLLRTRKVLAGPGKQSPKGWVKSQKAFARSGVAVSGNYVMNNCCKFIGAGDDASLCGAFWLWSGTMSVALLCFCFLSRSSHNKMCHRGTRTAVRGSPAGRGKGELSRGAVAHEKPGGPGLLRWFVGPSVGLCSLKKQ